MKISRSKKIKVLERDNYICQICGKKVVTDIDKINTDEYFNIDHIKPISKGGSNSYENLRTLCRKCNVSRKNIDIDDYRKILLKKAEFTLAETRLNCMCKEYGNEIVIKILEEAKEKVISDIDKIIDILKEVK